MRHITETQLHDVRSQAYMLIAELESIRELSGHGLYLGVTTEEVPNLRKSVALNLVARALGYTSWAHLTLSTKGREPNRDYVQLFSDSEEARDFFRAQLPGLNTLIVRDLVNILPDFRSKSELPYYFVEEVCAGYDLQAVNLSNFADTNDERAKTPEWTLYDQGDRSVGIYSFTAEFGFTTLYDLDRFLQRHIARIRADHDGSDMEKVFDYLAEKAREEASEAA